MPNRTPTLNENVSISMDDLTPQIPVQKDGHGSDANLSHNPTEYHDLRGFGVHQCL